MNESRGCQRKLPAGCLAGGGEEVSFGHGSIIADVGVDLMRFWCDFGEGRMIGGWDV